MTLRRRTKRKVIEMEKDQNFILLGKEFSDLNEFEIDQPRRSQAKPWVLKKLDELTDNFHAMRKQQRRKINKLILALLIVGFGSLAYAQKNEIGIFAIGNLNNHDYSVTLAAHTSDPIGIIGSNRSALGGGIEYRRALNRVISFGGVFDGAPSDGKLIVPAWYERQTTYIWPMSEYKLIGLVTERSPYFGKWVPWLSEGFGTVLTDGYSNSGWTAEPAIPFGFGIDYQINKRWAARVGDRWILTKIGCYGDPTCGENHQVIQEVEVGVAYKLGRRSK
jgi:hypothetical protein